MSERFPAIRLTMLPRDTNAHGTIFGGVILSYIDLAGGVECRRQSPKQFVTKFCRPERCSALRDSLGDFFGLWLNRGFPKMFHLDRLEAAKNLGKSLEKNKVLPGLEWVSPIGWGRDFGSSGTPTWKMVAGWNGAFSEV